MPGQIEGQREARKAQWEARRGPRRRSLTPSAVASATAWLTAGRARDIHTATSQRVTYTIVPSRRPRQRPQSSGYECQEGCILPNSFVLFGDKIPAKMTPSVKLFEISSGPHYHAGDSGGHMKEPPLSDHPSTNPVVVLGPGGMSHARRLSGRQNLNGLPFRLRAQGKPRPRPQGVLVSAETW